MSTQRDLNADAGIVSEQIKPRIGDERGETTPKRSTSERDTKRNPKRSAAKLDDIEQDDLDQEPREPKFSSLQSKANGFGTRLCEGAVLRYLGISLLLAYHYILWFVPNSFFQVQLLDDQVTFCWLANLLSTSVVMVIAGMITNRKRHLSQIKVLSIGAPIVLIVSTLGLQLLTGMLLIMAIPLLFAVLAGAAEGIMLILWAECLNRIRAHFSSINIGFTFGITMLICMLIAMALPDLVTSFFASLLALGASIILIYVNSHITNEYPQLLPRKTSKPALKNVAVICVIAFGASMALYYLAAIIPWEPLPLDQACFVAGPIFASVALIVIAVFCYYFRNRNLTFQFFPWFLVLTIFAFALFLANDTFNFAAFAIALTMSSLLEISLIVYLGVLIWRGYFSPGRAFASAVVPVRMGIMAGNGLAVFYEHFPVTAPPPVDETSLIFVVLIAVMLVPMVKREFIILSLTSAPPAPSDLDVTCQQIIEEFKLSEREGEILKLIARGNTANNVASKLVISPHTVNTHIRHIYEKIGIHKRGELIEYINMRKDE